jgi:glucose-6-phosphate isomerase
MIKIDYRNLLVKPGAKKYKKMFDKIKSDPTPSFAQEKPDLSYIEKSAKPFQKYKNVILIANGGSRTSALAFYQSLFEFRNKVNFEFLTSAEPELIKKLKKSYSAKDTLVLAISKSGDNINSIEPLLFFLNYPALIITGEQKSTLREIAQRKKWPIVIHPPVGGRFSGITTCGLVPAFLMGLNIKNIYSGAQTGYSKYRYNAPYEKNSALKLAMHFLELEKKGYTELFAGVYSTSLFGFFPLAVQLLHESTGKDGKGQTIFGDYSPESQHHTNQRLFGGRKNAIGLFMAVEKSLNDTKVAIPKNLQTIIFQSYPLKDLEGLKGSQTMHFDMAGVMGNCQTKKIPAVEIWIDEVSEKNIGEFMVFWHYFTVYSSLLRDQNPFDQPAVEDSKKISLRLRMKR